MDSNQGGPMWSPSIKTTTLGSRETGPETQQFLGRPPGRLIDATVRSPKTTLDLEAKVERGQKFWSNSDIKNTVLSAH